VERSVGTGVGRQFLSDYKLNQNPATKQQMSQKKIGRRRALSGATGGDTGACVSRQAALAAHLIGSPRQERA